MKVFFILNVLLSVVHTMTAARLTVTTCDRISRHGYPCESHVVQTSDGYLLTMFRIPYSHRLGSQNVGSRPTVLLMHCLLCSSDIWVLNGPNDGLPFLLADAGYDVWIANARGNVYSQQHVSLLTSTPEFWAFSWDEIALYDLPAKIEYALSKAGQQSMHYVAISQGTTVLMALLSRNPSYNQKIKTAHLLAPVAFACHATALLGTIVAPLLGRPGNLVNLLGTLDLSPFGELSRAIAPAICREPKFKTVCYSTLMLVFGPDPGLFNETLLPGLLETTPADGSTRQLLHYNQEFQSCQFKSYDYGAFGNIRKYGTADAPQYNLQNIQPATPIDLYFGDNDYLAAPKDVRHLANILGTKASLHRVPQYNHINFLLAKDVKMIINDCIVDRMDQYEGKSFNGSLCNNLINKPL